MMNNILIILTLTIVYIIVKPNFRKYIQHRVSENRSFNSNPLPDIGHYILPNLKKYYYVGDILVYLISFITLIYCVLVNSNGITCIIDIITIFIICIIIKLIMTTVTILPDSSNECEIKSTHCLGYCNDLLPSGHMMFVFITYMALYPKLPSIMHILYISLIFLVWLITISSRNHYTIDTLVSFFVSYTVISMYNNN